MAIAVQRRRLAAPSWSQRAASTPAALPPRFSHPDGPHHQICPIPLANVRPSFTMADAGHRPMADFCRWPSHAVASAARHSHLPLLFLQSLDRLIELNPSKLTHKNIHPSSANSAPGRPPRATLAGARSTPISSVAPQPSAPTPFSFFLLSIFSSYFDFILSVE